MSFKDFNDEGPGTFEWSFVLGGNTTGMFPDETHNVLDGDQLKDVTFTHRGGALLSRLITEQLIRLKHKPDTETIIR